MSEVQFEKYQKEIFSLRDERGRESGHLFRFRLLFMQFILLQVMPLTSKICNLKS
jgi:hypothetical protein